MPGTYAKETTVSRDRSIVEIERTLERYGASGFMYGWMPEGAMLGFVVGNRQYHLRVPMPDRNAREFTHTPKQGWVRTKQQAQEAYDQATRQRWRAMALYIKATLEAVELGIVTFDDAFLSFAALPGGGTVGQWARLELPRALATGQLSPLLPG